MDEETPLVVLVERQALEPGEMLAREFLGAARAIAVEGGVAAVVEPHHLVLAVGGGDQHVLVIAPEADDLAGPARLRLDQQRDHLAAALAAIDIVAQEHEAGGVVAAVVDAVAQEIGELGIAAVDVADRIGQDCRHPKSPSPPTRIYLPPDRGQPCGRKFGTAVGDRKS